MEKYRAGINLAEDERSIEDLRRYAYGIAENVCFEAYKEPKLDDLSKVDVERDKLIDFITIFD